MKKILFTLAAAAMVLGAASCQKEDLGKIETAKADGTPLDVITVVCGADTRLAIDGETLTPAFEADDEIFGWDDYGISYTYKCTAVDPTTGIATFGRISERGPSIRIGTLVNLIYAPGYKVEDVAGNALAVDLSRQGETLPVVMSGSGIVDSEGNCKVAFTNNVAIVEVKDALFPWVAEGEQFAVEFYGKYNALKFELDEAGAIAAKPVAKAEGWIASSVKSKADAESRISAKFVVPADGSDVLVSIKAKATDGSAYAFSAGEKKISSGKYINVPGKVFTPQYVAHINQKGYLVLSEAFEAANASKGDVTITMLESIEADSGINVNNAAGAKVTLDLNGRTLTYNGNKRIRVTGENTELIITDSSEDQTGEIIQVANDKGAISHYTGTLTVAGGKISNVSTTTVNTVNLSGGILNVTGGKITLDKESKSIISASAGTLNVTGGEIYSTAPKAPGISMSGTVVVNVKDAGKITSASNAVSASAGTLNIEGGYFTSGAGAAVIYKSKADAVFNVRGGYYSKAVTASYLTGSGYLCVNNTNPETKDAYPYKVAVPVTIAVGSGEPTPCASVEDAVKEANKSENKTKECTITLKESFTVNEAVNVENTAGVTLDLNGNTLTQNGTKRIGVAADGKLIIDDGSSDHSGAIGQSTGNAFAVSAGTLVIKGGSISTSAVNNAIYISGGSVEINGDNVSITSPNVNSNNAATSIVKLGSGSLKLVKGTIGSATNSGDNGNFTGVSVANGTFEMTGGYIYARRHAIIFSGTSGTGTASISGGLLATTLNNWSLLRFQDGSINALIIKGGGFTVKETSDNGKLFAGKTTGLSVPSTASVTINPGCYLSKNPIGTNGITASNVNGSVASGTYNYNGKSFKFKVQ